jgi:hypothetical protein
MRASRPLRQIDRRHASHRLRVRDLAALVDCHRAALVAKDGTIAWATLGRWRSPDRMAD